jgi:hypothetical protein
MQALHKILQCPSSYKDVFREVGLLEVFVTCLHRFAALLKDPQNGTGIYSFLIISSRSSTLYYTEGNAESIPLLEQDMGALTMEVLTQLLNSNNSNAGLFRHSIPRPPVYFFDYS